MADITKSSILNAIKSLGDEKINLKSLTLNSIKKIEQLNDTLTIDLSIPELPADGGFDNKVIADAIKKDFPTLKEVHLNIQTQTASPDQTRKSETILPGVKNTIAVASGKGGVGKSTVAVNLAVALAKDGARVGLIDADIYGPSIPLMLGLKEQPKIVKTEKGPRLVPLKAFGIKVISIGLLVDDQAPIIWRGPMASGEDQKQDNRALPIQHRS